MREGWEIKKLGEVCGFQNGFAFKSKTFKYTGIPLVRITNIQNDEIDLSKIVYINPSDYDKDLTRYKIKKGDLLIAMSGATTGKIGIHTSDEILLLNQRVGKFEPSKQLFKDFLFYFLSTKVEESLAISAGAAQPNLSTQQIKDFQIPFPPLPEQRTIVALLDAAFAKIDQAKANIEKNIENARELFQSKLNAVFSQRGEGWEERKLIELTSKIGSGATPRGGQSAYKSSGISLIRSLNVYDEGFKAEKLAFIDEQQAEKLKNVIIKKGDVLLNITGASVARCCIAPKEFLPARVNQHVSIIRIKDNLIHPEFLHYCLTSPDNKKELLGIGEQGATRQAITKSQIQNFSVKFPIAIKEQKEIVLKVNSLKEKIQSLESYYQIKLQNLEELKKSLLQKAFAGELTHSETLV